MATALEAISFHVTYSTTLVCVNQLRKNLLDPVPSHVNLETILWGSGGKKNGKRRIFEMSKREQL
jgi:hypothetical protein